MKTFCCAGIIFFTVLISSAWGNLTGQWSCNDGGTYYLRQAGSQIHWYGEAADAPPAWSHVFSGRIDGTRIKGNWTDVPKGLKSGSGSLELLIEKDGNALRVVKKIGGFEGSRWTRKPTDVSATRPLKPLKLNRNEECLRFNPDTLSIRQDRGRWKIVDGDGWLFDFGSNQPAAQKALKVIRHYHLDRSCFVGRPDPSFSYMLARGGSPSGAMTDEDCVAFDPTSITVGKIQGRWKIVSGRRGLFDFGNSEVEARKAFAVIRRHGFSQSCFVGRPDASFSYLRQ